MNTNIKLFNDILYQVEVFYKQLHLDKYEKTKGRKLALSMKQIISLALFKQVNHIATKKAVHRIFNLVCSYKTLVVNMNRFALLALLILTSILKWNRQFADIVKHTDSTDIPVCLNKNMKNHKTMKGLASWGHSGKGLYYGLKLHMTADLNRTILAIKFSSANVHDTHVFMKLNKDLLGLFVADAAYISQKLSEEFHIEGKRILLANPRKNMKKLITPLQYSIYNTRMLIELNFRSLKMFYGLITSLPRSVNGYLANYIYSLLAYHVA